MISIGDTIALVIANVDGSIGILGARTGAGPQIMAAKRKKKGDLLCKIVVQGLRV